MGHYIPATKEEQQELFAAIGISDIAELFTAVPDQVLLKEPLNLFS